MVDNSNIPFKYFLSKSNMSSVPPKTLKMSCMLQRRKSRIILERIEHMSTTCVLVDPLTKGLPPSVLREHIVDMGFMVEPIISGLPRVQVKILFAGVLDRQPTKGSTRGR
jgi:hypothetical protein